MNVILQEDVGGLGRMGDVVKVKDGYARNYLVPRGLALIADERNIAQLDHHRRNLASKAAKSLAEAKDKAEEVSKVSVSIRRQVGEEGKLFGSVSNRDIAEALAEEGIKVDRRQIVLEEPLKSIGAFDVTIELQRDVTAQVKVYVIQE